MQDSPWLNPVVTRTGTHALRRSDAKHWSQSVSGWSTAVMEDQFDKGPARTKVLQQSQLLAEGFCVWRFTELSSGHRPGPGEAAGA